MPNKEEIAAELGWWVFIDDQYAQKGPNLVALGPYPDEEAAALAGGRDGGGAAIVDGILQDGGVECWWEEKPPSVMHQEEHFRNMAYTLEVIIIDLTDPDHTG